MTTDYTLSCATCGRPSTITHYCGSKTRRPTAEELLPLVREYDAGASIRALAVKHGMSNTAIRNRLIWGGAWMRDKSGR